MVMLLYSPSSFTVKTQCATVQFPLVYTADMFFIKVFNPKLHHKASAYVWSTFCNVLWLSKDLIILAQFLFWLVLTVIYNIAK